MKSRPKSRLTQKILDAPRMTVDVRRPSLLLRGRKLGERNDAVYCPGLRRTIGRPAGRPYICNGKDRSGLFILRYSPRFSETPSCIASANFQTRRPKHSRAFDNSAFD